MAGRLLASGQTFVVDSMHYYMTNVLSSGNVWLGLMENQSTPSEGAQLPSTITEISADGYVRQLISSWTIMSGVDPKLSGSSVQFNVSGTWSSVYGYFVSETYDGNDALWAEVFPVGKGGDKQNGDTILITPIYEQKYYGET